MSRPDLAAVLPPASVTWVRLSANPSFAAVRSYWPAIGRPAITKPPCAFDVTTRSSGCASTGQRHMGATLGKSILRRGEVVLARNRQTGNHEAALRVRCHDPI